MKILSSAKFPSWKYQKRCAAIVVSIAASLLSGQSQAASSGTNSGNSSQESLLLLTQEKRDAAFGNMIQLAPTAPIKASDSPKPLIQGAPIDMTWSTGLNQWDLSSFMERQRASGMLILHHGKIRYEKYALGHTPDDLWIAFSVAKSFTSTLVGAAIKDGYINSVDDPLIHYIPELKGSGYNDVTIRQILTMTSGVDWSEDYQDPQSDVAQYAYVEQEDQLDPTITYMKGLQQANTPGEKWNYNTGETNLIGVLVAKATGKKLSDYLQEKIWQPYGMESDAAWMLNSGGYEMGGCCILATLRDYARMGQLVLDKGRIDGESIVPEGWFDEATQAHAGLRGLLGSVYAWWFNIPDYGYQWWVYDDGSFGAQGIFGQGIFIDPNRNLVIASNGNYPSAFDLKLGSERVKFYRAVQNAIDQELQSDLEINTETAK